MLKRKNNVDTQASLDKAACGAFIVRPSECRPHTGSATCRGEASKADCADSTFSVKFQTAFSGNLLLVSHEITKTSCRVKALCVRVLLRRTPTPVEHKPDTLHEQGNTMRQAALARQICEIVCHGGSHNAGFNEAFLGLVGCSSEPSLAAAKSSDSVDIPKEPLNSASGRT